MAVEGGEGAGKTVQSRILADRLGAMLTREPGGTPIGEKIRRLVLDRESSPLADRAEALLMAAARSQHADVLLAPALAAGRWVVTDRFVGSSLAYQGYGRGVDLDDLRWLSNWAAGGLAADLNVLIDVPFEVAILRRTAVPDRLESAGEEFHRRVAAGFAALSAADAESWVVVDGVGSPEVVADKVVRAVVSRLGWPADAPGTEPAQP
ncbi:MAG: dTMP kinase [Acidimicrobiales bacterium]